ncbi:hypothetical protein RN001_009150 [Aquatica leii]|uniref:Sodium-coupled monocarboxylate transporter 1 n=1 Tax=Aquatica leii TaxID=1421715 RepID=A0AAN7SFI4_9COLE|nr:hypothetical protein RN001_009150 [Aquatica leii]
MLLFSLLIGLYFGFCGKKQTPEEYLLGGKSMTVLPVGLSLIATQISGLTLLGIPSDVYLYGANYVWICVAFVFVCLLTSYIYLPVLMKLKVPSVFEYIKLRFGKHSRTLVCILYMLQAFIYIPIVAFLPAIALAQASGIYVHYITPVIGITCVFYTTIGGFKAVVWSHVLQIILIVGSVVAVFCLGIISVGGFSEIWNRAIDGQRLDIFDYTLDPTVRDGIWPILMGGTMYWLACTCFIPGSVQKFLSVSKFSSAKKVVYIMGVGMIVLIMFSVITGLMVYTKYYLCDPILNGAVTRRDQILPYFAMDVAGKIPGLPGMFTAGIFSAALSTMSSTYNALAVTIYGDFVSLYISVETSKKWSKVILQTIVAICGVISIVLTLLIDYVGTLLAFANASIGLINGLLVGMFTLGMVFPNANTKGVLWGSVLSFLLTLPIAVLNQWYKIQGVVETFAKPISVEGCDLPINVTASTLILKDDQPFVLFRLSIWYNPVISFTLVMVIGLIVSYFTQKNEKLDPDLISPISKSFIKPREVELSPML